MEILNTILPVFLIIALGYCLRWRKFFDSHLVAGVSRLTYWIGLPALLFYKTATAGYDLQHVESLFIVVMSGMVAAIAAAFILGRLLRQNAEKTALMIQGAFRGNLVYIGIPIILYSLAGAPEEVARAESLVVIVIALTVPVYNICAVVALLAGRHQFDRRALMKMLRGIATNPLLLASIAGVLYNIYMPPLNPVIYRTLEAIGQMALPLALFTIGATLYQERIGHSLLPASGAALIKVTVSPLAGLAVAGMIGVSGLELRLALLLLACPTAISSHIMAEQIVGRQNLSAAIVILSTLFSIAAFIAILAYC